jgi:CubicO group peptidase (beta-lactamase class C family)
MAKNNHDFGLTEDYITKAMADWEIPGMSIVVVKDGQTVYSKGFGLRKLGSKDLVDEHTLFTIGSCTKAFTATAIAMLAMDGKLSWDDPVRKFLPDFALADEEVAAKLTLRDIASHQSGVEDGAITKIPYDNDKDAIAGLKLLKPVQPWRGGFAYNNTMLAVLGKVVEKASGMSWEAFLQTRILNPLGMNESRPTMKSAESVDNRATAHQMGKREKLEVMKVKSLDFLASSAALQANVVDLAEWLKFHLGTLSAEKQALLSKTLLDEMHSEQLLVEPNPFTLMMHPGSSRHGYGLAWFVRDYGGTRLVQHGGYVDGFTSFAVMGPSHGFGVFVLTNMHNSLAPFALAYRVIDAYLGVEATDWSAYFLAKRAEHRNKVSPHKHEQKEEKTKPLQVAAAGTKKKRAKKAGKKKGKHGSTKVKAERKKKRCKTKKSKKN